MSRHTGTASAFITVLVILAGCTANSPTATTTPSPTTPSATPSPVPAPSPTAGAPSGGLLPEGTWQAKITAVGLIDAGWTVDDLSPGTYTFTIDGAKATLEAIHETGHTDFCEAEMSVLSEHVKFDYDPAGGDCGDLEEVVDWELRDDGLHLILISTTGGYPESQKAQMEAATWQPVDPVVSTVAPGMVDIGGRSLFMECRGSGSPTVVFLQGTEMSSRSMRGIEDALLDEGSVRVCNYDRAGEGRSDPAAAQQDDLDVVDDLSALLAAAQIDPPYVLVGHSIGGDQTWLYADRHPEGVAAFMLMNAGFFELDWDSLHDVWSQAEIDEERAHSEEILGSVKQAATPPDDVPYVVMMSTIAQCGSATDICGRIYPKFEEWGREIAGRTGSGRLVSIDAGHEIYLTELDRVVEELQLLTAETRSPAEPAVSPSPDAGALNYVALGDSLLYALESDCDSCTSAAHIYGAQMATDLGVPVTIHNLTTHNNLNSSGLRGYLERGAQVGRDPEDIVEAVAAADAVSVTIGFNDFPQLVSDPAFRLDAYRDNLDATLGRIQELRDGKPTLLLVTQIYNNGGPAWKGLLDSQNEIICDVAAAHDAVCVDIYRPFNGEDGSADPIAAGYLGPDQTHPSQLGMDVIAAAMVDAGYGPLE